MQRVPVRVEGQTLGVSEIDDADQAEVAPVDERIGREEEPNAPLAEPEAPAAPRAVETQGMRLQRKARDLAAAW